MGSGLAGSWGIGEDVGEQRRREDIREASGIQRNQTFKKSLDNTGLRIHV